MFSLTSSPWVRRWFGTRSERAAAAFLRNLGLSIIEHNFRCDLGEIDIIALDGKTLVFVEVRSTEAGDTRMPALSVDGKKQTRLTRLALFYLQSRKLLDCSARFDVLAVSWPADRADPVIAHYPNAFEATDRFQMFS